MFTFPDPVASTFKRLGLAPECIATRPDPDEPRHSMKQVRQFISDVQKFERHPLTNLRLSETSILVRSPTFHDARGFLTSVELVEPKGTFPGNLGEDTHVGLTLGWRGLVSKTPTLYVSLFDGYTDGYSGRVRASSRLGRDWIAAVMTKEGLSVAKLEESLIEHVRCARLFHLASGPEFTIDHPLRITAVNELCKNSGWIARKYVENLLWCAEPVVVTSAVDSFSEEERNDRALFHEIINAMLVNDGGQEALAHGLQLMKMDRGTLTYGVQCAEHGSTYTFCDLPARSERVVACLREMLALLPPDNSEADRAGASGYADDDPDGTRQAAS